MCFYFDANSVPSLPLTNNHSLPLDFKTIHWAQALLQSEGRLLQPEALSLIDTTVPSRLMWHYGTTGTQFDYWLEHLPSLRHHFQPFL